MIGVLVAAPVGPMALLALRRTLERGWASGIASGLGIATADAIYAAVAAFALTAISGLILGHAVLVQVAGGAAIAGLGIRTLVARPSDPGHPAGRTPGFWVGDYLSCLVLTLANPPTILSFAAILAGVGVGTGHGGWPAAAVVAGVVGGSAAWWVLLTGAAHRARHGLSARARVVLTRGAGAAMGVLGVVVMVGVALRH